MKGKTVTLEELNTISKQDFIARLATIFEHSPWVGKAVVEQRPFESEKALYQAMVAAVKSASEERKLALICAHPDLAGKAARLKQLTAHSQAEQKGAGLDSLSDDEFKQFQQLNAAYRAKFSFPFIIAVRGHGGKAHDKYSILAAMAKRLENTVEVEKTTALAEIYRIGELRLKDLFLMETKNR